MPRYHFRCPSCGKETDMKLPFGSTEQPQCEGCKASMEKFIVPPNVHFKGGGFYKTDAKKPVASTESPAPKTTPVPPPSPPPVP